MLWTYVVFATLSRVHNTGQNSALFSKNVRPEVCSTNPWYGPLTVVLPLYGYKLENFLASIKHDSRTGSLPAEKRTRV